MTSDLQFGETASCDFPAEIDHVPPALDRFRQWLEGHGLTTEAWNGIHLALAEALNNAVLHGCRNHPQARVHATCSWRGAQLEFAVTDPGQFAPGPAWYELPTDPLAESGRGGFLIRAAVDTVEHRNTAEGHTLILRKQVGHSVGSGAGSAETRTLLDGLTVELGTSYETISALFRLGELLASTDSVEDFIRRAIELLASKIRARAIFVRLPTRDGAALRLVAAHGISGPSAEIRPGAGVKETEAFSSAREAVIEDCATLPADDPLRSLGAGGALIVPLRFRESCSGLLVLGCPSDGGFLTAGESNLARSVADALANAIALAELRRRREDEQRTAHELHIAAEIQAGLLPRSLPTRAAFRIEGICRSAREIGGDFYDAIDLPGRGVLLVIADVMGKGVPAALFATVVRAAVRCLLPFTDDLGAVLTEINRRLAPDLEASSMFVTCQLVLVAEDGRSLAYANAGHGPLCLLREHGRDQLELDAGAEPIGVLPDSRYTTANQPLCGGDTVVLLTDGMYECRNAEDQVLGAPALNTILRECAAHRPHSLCGEVLDRVSRFTGDTPAADDQTLVCVRLADRLP